MDLLTSEEEPDEEEYNTNSEEGYIDIQRVLTYPARLTDDGGVECIGPVEVLSEADPNWNQWDQDQWFAHRSDSYKGRTCAYTAASSSIPASTKDSWEWRGSCCLVRVHRQARRCLFTPTWKEDIWQVFSVYPTRKTYVTPVGQITAIWTPQSLTLTCLNSSGTAHGLMQCPVKGDTPYFTSVQFWMLRRALQAHRQGQKTFPPKYWKQLYTTAIREGPTLRMAKSTDTTKIAKPDMKKCSLPQLGSYMTKTLLSQGLRQMVEQSRDRVSMKPTSTYTPLTSCVLGLGMAAAALQRGGWGLRL